jgi:hypothetical protein
MRIPRSFYIWDLKEPQIEKDVCDPHYGRMVQLRCDTDMEYRDLVSYDDMLFTVSKTVITHPDYCIYRLVEKDKFEYLLETKRGEERNRNSLIFLPTGWS